MGRTSDLLKERKKQNQQTPSLTGQATVTGRDTPAGGSRTQKIFAENILTQNGNDFNSWLTNKSRTEVAGALKRAQAQNNAQKAKPEQTETTNHSTTARPSVQGRSRKQALASQAYKEAQQAKQAVKDTAAAPAEKKWWQKLFDQDEHAYFWARVMSGDIFKEANQYYDPQYEADQQAIAEQAVADRENAGALGKGTFGNTVMTGVSGIAREVASTLDTVMPTEFLGKYDPFSFLSDDTKRYNDYWNARRLASLEGKGKAASTLSEFGVAAVEAIPTAIEAILTGGGSLADDGLRYADDALRLADGAARAAKSYGTKAGKWLGTTFDSAKTVVNRMLHNPQYYMSAARTLGTDYEEAKANGASDEQAAVYAILSTGLNAAIEVGGGIETLPKALREGGGNAAVKWLLSMPEEGIEEVLQRFTSGTMQKTVYDPDKKVLAWNDEDAIISPVPMAKEFAMGTAVGGLLGGGQVGVSSAYNAAVKHRLSKIGADYDIVQKELIEEGLSFGNGYTAYDVAEELLTKAENGEKISSADLGRLVSAIEQSKQTEERNTPAADTSAIAAELVKAGATEAEAESLAPILSAVLNGEEISGNQAGTIAKNQAAVSVLETATGEAINTDAPLGEVKSAIRSLANRQSNAMENAAAVDTPAAENAAETVSAAPAEVQTSTNPVASSGKTAVQDFASTLGKAGEKVFSDMYDGGQNAVAYIDAMMKAYNAGKNGGTLYGISSQTVNPAQLQAAYIAGQADAGSVPTVAKTGEKINTNFDNTLEGATESNGETEIHLRNGSQRIGSADPGGQVSPVAQSTGGAQIRQTAVQPADSGTAHLTYGEKVSAASLGIGGGSTTANIRLVTGGDTKATAAARKLAKKRGLRLVLFAGDNLEIREEDGSWVSVRGYISGDRVFVRVDHPRYTADQIMRHEAGHDMIDKGEVDVDAVRERIAENYDPKQAAQLYADAYEGTGMTADEIWTEVICDSLGDMNIFADTLGEELAGALLTETKKAVETKGETPARAPPSATDTNAGGKASVELAQKNTTEGGGITKFSAKDRSTEFTAYMKAGTRHNNAKQRAIDRGFNIFLTSDEEIRDYIHKAISGEDIPAVVYGKVGDRLANDVAEYSNGKIDVTGYYTEFIASDIQHAYDEHLHAKQEGDIDLAYNDFLSIADYILDYDELVYAIRYASNQTKICVSKKLPNGHAIIIETVSKGRAATQFKNMIGVTSEKYQSEYIEKRKRSAANTRGNKSSTNTLRDANASSSNIVPQPKIPVKTQDTAYLAAVKRGDMATAQKMVDEKAEEFGYTIFAYHGSRHIFNVFSKDKRGSNTRTETSKKWFFAGDKATANSYYPYGVMKELARQNPKIWKDSDAENMKQKGKLYSLYLKMENPLIVDVAGYDYAAHREKADAFMEYVEQAERDGNDGIILLHVRDNQLRPSAEESTVYMFQESAQAKLADPVTYDDDGNVIPLSERFSSEKDDVRYSRELDVDRAAERAKNYTYEALIAKPDMKVATVDDTVQYPTDRQTRKEIVKEAKKNAALIGKTNQDGSVSVYVDDIGADVLLSGNGLKHGLDRRLQDNAAVTLHAGEILQNAVRINELTPELETATDTYVLLGAAEGKSGAVHIVEFVVNRFDNEVVSIDVLYSVNAKKESAVLNAPESAENPLLVTDSTISIARLLDLARDNFPDILPESVLRHYGFDARPDGKLGSTALFSRELESLNDLREENEALREKVEYWKGQTKRTTAENRTVRKGDIDKLAKRIIAEYDSTLKAADIAEDLLDLGNYIIRDGDGKNELTWTEVKDRAAAIARNVVRSASVLAESNDLHREIKSSLHKQRIAFHDDIPDFNDFRKRNMGKFILAKDGLPIDVLWMSLNSEYGEMFPNEITHPTDQLLYLADLLDKLQPVYENPFSYYMAEATEYLANDIIDSLISEEVRQAPPTFADRQAAKLDDQKAKDQEKLENLRAQKNERIAEIRKQGQERAKEALRKVRADRDAKIRELKEHYRTKDAKARESRKASALRAKIQRHVKELSSTLLRPSDKHHVPEALRGPVARLLEAINLESNYELEYGKDARYHHVKPGESPFAEVTKRTQAFAELKKAYAAIGGELVIDPDLLGDNGAPGLFDEVAALADKPIAAMNAAELEIVWQTIRAVEASIRSANRMFAQARFQTVSEAAEALRRDNDGKNAKTELGGPGDLLGKAQRLVGIDMLTPEAFLHRLGESGDAIFRMMRSAQDEHIRIMKAVSDFTHEALADVNVRALEKELHTVTLGGEEVKLSTAQLMELYALMRREQAQAHILAGGILPDAVSAKGIKKNTKAEPIRGITQEEILQAVSLLTAEQVAIAEKLQEYASTELSDFGNKASMAVYNYKKFNEPHYWPIRSNRQETKSTVETDTATTSVANRGFTKATKPNANTSVMLGSIFDTFATHASEMATYAAWLGTTEDINRIRNFVFYDGDGNRAGSVKGIFDRVHGSKGSAYLQKLLSDIANGVKGTHGETEYMSGLAGNYKAAAVGANLRVIIQQPTAILRALDMVDPKYFVGIPRTGGWKKALRYAPIAQWKDWGYFDINTGRQMKDVLFDSDSVLNKVKNVSMWGAGKMDSASWGLLWNAVERETKAEHKELKPGTKEYYDHVAARFNEIIDRTQVVDGILQRSQIMRSGSGLTKMATAFMGEPTKQYNMLLSSAYDASHATGKENRTAAKKRLARTAFVLALSGIINAAVQSIIDAVRDDDKEKDYWEKWLAAFTGFTGEEEDFGEYFAAFWSGNLESVINPAQYIPYAKDAVSLLQGYDVSRMDMESVEKTISAAQNMLKALRGEGKWSIAGASANLFAEVARMLGIPVANLKREVKSFAMLAAVESGNYLLQYRMEKASLNLNYSGNSKTFTDILYNAFINDREAYEFIYADMVKSGFDPEKIKNAMEKRMKADQDVKSVDDLELRYLNPTQQRQYDSSLSVVKRADVWNKADKDQRDKALDLLYEMTVGSKSAEAALEVVADGANVGLTDEEYILYKLALDVVDQPTKNGKMGSYTQDEAEDALDLLGFDVELAAYLWQSTNSGWSERSNPYS